jgi:putative serine protease PepD
MSVNLALAAVLGAATGWWIWLRPQSETPASAIARLQAPDAPSVLASAPADASSLDEQNNIEVYRTVSPAVVNITSTTIQYDFFFNPFPVPGSGSGFLIDENGNIVTNDHVISGARAVEVILADQSRYPAKLVGRDPVGDLAVIKIDAGKKLPYVKLGSSDSLQVGQKVLAIGNPFGFESTLTTGVISSVKRTLRDAEGNELEETIQTDAAINPGNSGGPLLNSRGEVIGINTRILGETNLGIGFAIPIDLARPLLTDLVQDGRVHRASLGLIGQEVSPPLARLLNLPTPQGLLIAQLAPGGPAERAGLRGGRQLVIIGNQQVAVGGDWIVQLDGAPVSSTTDLNRYLRRKKPGDVAKVTLFRDGKQMTIDVRLGERAG